MMSNRGIYSGYKERENVNPGRFISGGQNNHNVLRSYSRNTSVVRNTGVSPSSSRTNSAISIIHNYDYRTHNNFTKRDSSFDWLTDSETGTPDFQSPDSDSSTGSLLSRTDAAAAKRLAEEWEKLERTLYNEEGPKVTQKHLIEECKQWRELFPHLRVIGRQLDDKNGRQLFKSKTEAILENSWENEEAMHENQFIFNHYSPNSSTETESNDEENTPSYFEEMEIKDYEKNKDTLNAGHKLTKKFSENDNITKMIDQKQLELSLGSLLHITPIKLTNSLIGNSHRGSHYSSILRSEISSSRWRRNVESPDNFYSRIGGNNSLPILPQNSHNSAKPILMNESKKKVMSSLSAGVNRTGQWKVPLNTAVCKNQDVNWSEPLSHPFSSLEKSVLNSTEQHSRQQGDTCAKMKLSKIQRKVSLPPIRSNDTVYKNTPNSGIYAIRSSKKKSLIPLNVDRFNSNNSILKIFDSEPRRVRGKYSSNENKKLEHY